MLVGYFALHREPSPWEGKATLLFYSFYTLRSSRSRPFYKAAIDKLMEHTQDDVPLWQQARLGSLPCDALDVSSVRLMYAETKPSLAGCQEDSFHHHRNAKERFPKMWLSNITLPGFSAIPTHTCSGSRCSSRG
jgi:hypothetical protein